MSHKLMQKIKSLLGYAGSNIKEVMHTADGSIIDVDLDGEDVRIFVMPKAKGKPRAFDESYSYEY